MMSVEKLAYGTVHFELVAVRRHSHTFSVSPTTDTALEMLSVALEIRAGSSMFSGIKIH